jgi:hypothetical protein
VSSLLHPQTIRKSEKNASVIETVGRSKESDDI